MPSDRPASSTFYYCAKAAANDIHPIYNRRVLEYLRQQIDLNDAAVNAWCATRIEAGFDAFDVLLAADPGRGDFCFGEAPTLADNQLGCR